MEMFIALMAMVVAMVAVFVGTSAQAKSQQEMMKFADTVRAEIALIKGDQENRIGEVLKQANRLDNKLIELSEAANQSKLTANMLKEDIDMVRKELAELERSIPDQYKHKIPHMANSVSRD